MRLLEAQNLYSDCVDLKLEATPVPSESAQRQCFDLYLTLQFGQQEKSLLQGRLKFGLRGGCLQLKLDSAEIEGLEPFSSEFCQVALTSSRIHPLWTFALKPGESFLSGSLKQVKLGRVSVTAAPCRLAATFTLSTPDLAIADIEGLWRHDISPNKAGILERAIALFLLKNRLQPYLSWVQLASPATVAWQSLGKGESEAIAPQSLVQLQELIGRVYGADTDNLLELAQLAGLNPLEELAGANLLAGELGGVSLSGANLAGANLRGSNLTDADLSEANLRAAKLSGADLSGAYLGNADLREADLHRASLALANLIGANLQAANLKEANLSNANLSGAIVREASFVDNPGLTQQMKRNLQERGAIVE